MLETQQLVITDNLRLPVPGRSNGVPMVRPDRQCYDGHVRFLGRRAVAVCQSSVTRRLCSYDRL